ncbi:hypothetical protein [Cellulomonas bogoriensis]|uniref:DUF2510 domain-containing protein n=1 Tax=Cellulomonas bogoriensis 69B4 = DSM 16987 TaxID=1386082 RepID=A0A0A0BNY1_9CELL|nr:hypothetical protein [Cellulomonas bogoriensis]KGM09661.1 hypothetical protein N869_06280 [Cellulomonas bogoriensis 69B4 = DSM 16987]
MTHPDLPVGWHADLEANRYRYWDGERWAFTSSARDLEAYRAAGQVIAGVDFDAPVHTELPPEKKPRRARGPLLVAAVAVGLVAVVVLAVVLG